MVDHDSLYHNCFDPKYQFRHANPPSCHFCPDKHANPPSCHFCPDKHANPPSCHFCPDKHANPPSCHFCPDKSNGNLFCGLLIYFHPFICKQLLETLKIWKSKYLYIHYIPPYHFIHTLQTGFHIITFCFSHPFGGHYKVLALFFSLLTVD